MLNMYGVGIYFAADARLSAWFERSTRDGHGRKQLILARVALGNMAERGACRGCTYTLGDDAKVNKELLKPEWKKPPQGAQSATGAGNRTEAIVYQNDQAFPHYRVSYTAGPRPYPYDDSSLGPVRKRLIDTAPETAQVHLRDGVVASFGTR